MDGVTVDARWYVGVMRLWLLLVAILLIVCVFAICCCGVRAMRIWLLHAGGRMRMCRVHRSGLLRFGGAGVCLVWGWGICVGAAAIGSFAVEEVV